MVLIAWSMCDSSTISGGDRAMMSPVVRISRPRSCSAACCQPPPSGLAPRRPGLF
jgi:hypothetical protein